MAILKVNENMLSTGSRTLSQYGIAAVYCVDVNMFVVAGAGIS